MQSAAPGSETTVGTDEGAPIDERHELAAQANAHQHPRARTALGIEVVSLFEVGSRLGHPAAFVSLAQRTLRRWSCGMTR